MTAAQTIKEYGATSSLRMDLTPVPMDDVPAIFRNVVRRKLREVLVSHSCHGDASVDIFTGHRRAAC